MLEEKFLLFSIKKGSRSKDHLIRSSFLKLLSSQQAEVLLRNSSEETTEDLIEFGSNPDALGVYKIPDWKMFFYLLKYKIFSKVKTR